MKSLGWMVTTKGLWQTTEAGKNWAKLPKPPAEILRVYFVDENNGWAVGAKKSVLETHDGGAALETGGGRRRTAGQSEYSAYTWIAFANPETALITGWNIPERRLGDELPDWMDPETALLRRDLPHLNYTLTTHDGGKTWSSRSASLFGETRASASAAGRTRPGADGVLAGFPLSERGLSPRLAHRQERQHLQDAGLRRQRHLAGSGWHGVPGRHAACRGNCATWSRAKCRC